MSDTSRFLTALGRVIRSLTGERPSASTGAAPDVAAARSSVSTAAPVSPGQAGPSATVEIDPRRLRDVRLAYTPSRDGEPDPGEIVWTWVPYEERDGRGKDRPVAIVAASAAGDYLAVQLTSKAHDGDRDFVPWATARGMPRGRPSWARIDRVFRVRVRRHAPRGGLTRRASIHALADALGRAIRLALTLEFSRDGRRDASVPRRTMQAEGRPLVVAAQPELAEGRGGGLIVAARHDLDGAAESLDGRDRGLEVVDPGRRRTARRPRSPPWTPAGTPAPSIT